MPLLLLAVVALTVLGTPTLSAMPLDPPGAGDPVGDDPTLPPSVEPPAPPPPPDDALTGYYVRVSVADQEVWVYLDGEIIRTMVCSTGVLDDRATPTGRFYIQNRGERFFSEKYQQGALWWVSFRDWGIYLFHSVPIDRAGNIIPEEAAKLGTPASHGCVRLSVEDARWFYETIPQDIPVDIQ